MWLQCHFRFYVIHLNLQNDIVGQCFAEYTVSERGYSSITIRKTKDILGCTKRNGYESGIRAIPYTSSSVSEKISTIKSITIILHILVIKFLFANYQSVSYDIIFYTSLTYFFPFLTLGTI